MNKNILHKWNQTLELPVIVAPMFLISNPTMVIKACQAGVIGSFPVLNARTADILDEWMTEINNELGQVKEEDSKHKVAPWAVNFICHRPHNKRYDEDLKLIEKHQPPIVITSLGDPSPVVNVVHSYGGIVFSDVINPSFAKKAIEKGTDGLVLITNGAGGHGGTLNPFAFYHEVRTFWNGPIILGGGISKGEDILAAKVLGADLVYMGTKFITAQESGASDDYKEMVLNASIEDILYTPAISGIHANFLIPSLIKAGIDPKALQKDEKMKISNESELKAWKDFWSAGQGVGSIKSIQPIQEIVNELKEQFYDAKKRMMNDSLSVYQR